MHDKPGMFRSVGEAIGNVIIWLVCFGFAGFVWTLIVRLVLLAFGPKVEL